MEVNKCTYKLVCMNKYINFLHAYVCVEIYIYLTYLNFLLYMYGYIYNKILYMVYTYTYMKTMATQKLLSNVLCNTSNLFICIYAFVYM